MKMLHWDDNRIKRITRLRFLSDPGHPWWDWSYGTAVTHDGEEVGLYEPDWKMWPLSKSNLNGVVLATAHRDGTYQRIERRAISTFQ
ncbi:MAG: hypothetical protein EBV86_15045 [Marivivens sp.]|nr:hypothetical protein [Marivivens sp.]